MKISNRTLGIISLLCILALIASIVIGMIVKERRSISTITVIFDDVGSLQPQDPVTIQGVPIGSIQKIKWDPKKQVRVTIRFSNPIILRKNAQFINENYSLMGARRINIKNPKDGPILNFSETPKGIFEPGIAESLHLMTDVRTKVTIILEVVRFLALGDSSSPSLAQKAMGMLDEVEKSADLLERVVNQSWPVLKKTIEKTDSISIQTIQTTNTSREVLNNLHQKSVETITNTAQLLQTLQKTLHNIDIFLTELENKKIYKSLLEKKELILSLTQMVHSLKKIAMFISTEGLNTMDSLGNPQSIIGLKNIHFFKERSSEKARKNLK